MRNIIKWTICAIIAAFAVLAVAERLSALNADRIVAWPVPFNPSRQVLTIDFEPGSTTYAHDSVKIEIFDINGDRVYEGQYSHAMPVRWGGRNMSGTMVHPGMYIIKVTVEDSATGGLGRRIIRIVVVR